MKILAFLLITLMAFADTIINDPVFKPPQFTTATRPTCPSTYGCFGYNTEIGQFEVYDGVEWKPVGSGLLSEWVTGTSYKVGQLVNGGVDKNWLLKVEQDHISGDIDLDLNSGKLRPLSPPLITTGIQSGGALSLTPPNASITGGSGYIANYTGSVSPFPIIKSIEWTGQSIALPATGIHTLMIDVNGAFVSVPGLGTSQQANDNIIVGVADMNLGTIYRRGTYPTNPIGQLRGLATFLGAMTKGLSYTATGLTMARSAHQFYFWGTDNTDPYDPNTKLVPAMDPLQFFEFTQTGATSPAVLTTFKTSVYDNAGALVTMGNNKWGFARIYLSLGAEDFVMYSQAEYPGEVEAKEAAVNAAFIKPPDIQLSKFAAYVVYQKGDADLSDNKVFTCEPFGCDSSGGGGAGGGGNVTGPATAVTDNITTFADSTGKVIKDSGIPISAIGGGGGGSGDVVGPATSVANNLPSFADATGKLIKDSGIPAGVVQVVDPPQWYYYAGGDINGSFAFPAPTDSKNDKTLFTYSGTTLTALKPIKIDFSSTASQGSNVSAVVTINPVCIINGVSRDLGNNLGIGSPAVNASSIGSSISASVLLSTGDTCTINFSRTVQAFARHAVNITATALPQTAVLTANPNMPAGFYARRTWTSGTWARTSLNTWANFTPVATTVGPPEGFAITDIEGTDGQLPRLTLSTLKKGRYRASLVGAFLPQGGSLYCQSRFVVSNSTGPIANGISGHAGTGGTYTGVLTQILNVSNDITNGVLDFQMTGYNSSAGCSVTAPVGVLEITLEYLPDLSLTANQSWIATVDRAVAAQVVAVSDPVEEFRTYPSGNAITPGSTLTYANILRNTLNKCLTYSAGMWTAVKTCKIDISCGAEFAGGTGSGIVNIQTLNNTAAFSHNAIQGSLYNRTNVSWTGILNAGENLTCVNSAGSSGNTTTTFASLTATPMPEVARIMKNPNTQAGVLGTNSWSTINCLWSKSTATIGPFPPDTDCVATRRGLAIPDAVNNGQLPAITLSKLPKGEITVIAYGSFSKSSNSSNMCYDRLYVDGVAVATLSKAGDGNVGVSSTPNRIWTFNNPSEKTNAKIEIYNVSSGSAPCEIYGYDTGFTLSAFYSPDLSNPDNQSYIAVVEGEAKAVGIADAPQWYFYTVAANISGNFTFPAPTDSKNDKTLFTYSGTTMTMLKPATVTFNVSGGNRVVADGSPNPSITYTCIVSGISRTYGTSAYIASGSPGHRDSWTLPLNAGDNCTINISSGNTAYGAYMVSILAQSLPSIATVIASPNLPAGFWAAKSWNYFLNCTWQVANTGADLWFPNDPECGSATRTLYGKAIADTTLDGQLPKMRLASMPKGYYQIVLGGIIGDTSGAGGYSGLKAWVNRTYSSTSRNGSYRAVGAGIPSNTFLIYVPTDLTNPEIEFSCGGTAGNCTLTTQVSAGGEAISIAAYYYPDLSDPYNQSMVAVLPPQVINSSGKKWRTESCYITNSGTAVIGNAHCNSWIQSVNRAALGNVIINVMPNLFLSGSMSCSFLPAGTVSPSVCNMNNAAIGNNTINTMCRLGSTAAAVDEYFYINCQGWVP